MAKEAAERHRKGQPVLLGTVSIEKNELLSSLLNAAGVPHETLNAKNHEREGAIIAQAGKLGAVTVATNMAGRGVDIILGGNPQDILEAQKVRELGGLCVIGTDRHEARRIDNQLRGRSGRQGDQGETRFYLSLEDDLLRIFGGDRIKGLMSALNVPEDVPIESKMVSRAVNQAQTKVEGMNFDARKHLLDFDDVLNKQRAAVYRRRQEILDNIGNKTRLSELIKEALGEYFSRFSETIATAEDSGGERFAELKRRRLIRGWSAKKSGTNWKNSFKKSADWTRKRPDGGFMIISKNCHLKNYPRRSIRNRRGAFWDFWTCFGWNTWKIWTLCGTRWE